MPWMSKALRSNGKRYGAAHFVGADGVPACARIVYSDGRPRMAPFKATFVSLRPDEHLCRYCRMLHHGTCECGKCGIERKAS